MRLVLGLILVLIGSAAMAREGEQRFDVTPRRQMVAPGGQVRSTQDKPGHLEGMIRMWRNMFGDQPLPDHITKKYNVSPDAR
jgi:hypothetical protein